MNRKYAIQPVKGELLNKDDYLIKYFDQNKAYLHQKELVKEPEKLINQLKNKYLRYRLNWREIPRKAIESKLSHDFLNVLKSPPQCVDIELCSICDLACPFCYRQHLATPDKYINKDLAYRIIDQCADLGVPSIKLNWRGEPLMHKYIPEFIHYAKKKGILEVSINTNATHLTSEMSKNLIEAGLDVMIYSFDGGTRKTYNKMRVGRFQKNEFNNVYNNIRNFYKIRQKLKSAFPFTKIQMILTKDTYNEQDSFHKLFNKCVDNVSTKAYSERGGNIDTITKKERENVLIYFKEKYGVEEIHENLRYWKDNDGNMYIEDGRIACEQIYQRLMVSYDGRVFMCCYDWGNEHPIGFVSDQYFINGDKDYHKVIQSINVGKKGFEMMEPIMPDRRIKSFRNVQTLKQIWDGKIINGVRKQHVKGNVNSINICKKCDFKETYSWQKI